MSRSIKYPPKSARSKWPQWQKDLVDNLHIHARFKFSLKDASFNEIVSHFMENSKNNATQARNDLKRTLNLTQYDPKTLEKIQKVLHYFDFVLISPTNKAKDPLPSNIWDIFENLLKSHDWYYMYNDSGKEYNKQLGISQKIKIMYKNLSEKDPEKAKEIYNKYKKDVKKEEFKEDSKENSSEILKRIKKLETILKTEKNERMIRIYKMKIQTLKNELKNDDEYESEKHQDSIEKGFAHF